MSEERLDRQASAWFLYQNPTASSIEVWTEAEEWEALAANTVPLHFDYFHAKLAANLAGCKLAEISQFQSMRQTVNMLAKWKQANEANS